MNGLEGFWIEGLDSHLGSVLCQLERVANLGALLLHDRHSGRNPIMNEHWDLEVIRAKHRGDVGQMGPDLVAGGVIVLCFRVNGYNATVG
ncbi:MAG: hypothetical protein QOJ42_3515 [Acidobacteriaceae bacterium]|nr:hypothetical protein [Acidobacteriaceae bacterium]